MKAFRYYGPGDGRIEELPVPEIRPGEVLIKVRASGICATDVKTLKRGHPKIKPGSVLGHEVAGEIVKLNDVSGWKEGQKVIAAPYAPCGVCSQCQRGRFSLCNFLFDETLDPGGFSEYIRVPSRIVQRGLVALPENTSFVEGCLAEPLACCIHGLDMLDIQKGESLLIVGDGPMGLIQVQLGKLSGAEPVILSGATPERLKFASAVADVVINVDQESVHEVIERLSDDGVDKVMVSVGIAEVAQDSLSLVGKGGTINLYAGLPRDSKITMDANQIHYDGVRVLGSFGFEPNHFQKAVNLITSNTFDMKRFITNIIEFEGIPNAIERAANYQGIKTVIDFS
jgi:L-iditol 2-dehydrogenase